MDVTKTQFYIYIVLNEIIFAAIVKQNYLRVLYILFLKKDICYFFLLFFSGKADNNFTIDC